MKTKDKRIKMKIGELNINPPYNYCSVKKPIWGWFEKSYWTDDKMMLVLNINFTTDELERLSMLSECLSSLKLGDGVRVATQHINVPLHNKGLNQDFSKQYFKLFLNVDIDKISIKKVLHTLNIRILKAITKYDLKVDTKKLKPLMDMAMVSQL